MKWNAVFGFNNESVKLKGAFQCDAKHMPSICKVRFKCLCACDFPCQDAMAFEDVFGHGANLG